MCQLILDSFFSVSSVGKVTESKLGEILSGLTLNKRLSDFRSILSPKSSSMIAEALAVKEFSHNAKRSIR